MISENTEYAQINIHEIWQEKLKEKIFLDKYINSEN
jgi:hypothetical protein